MNCPFCYSNKDNKDQKNLKFFIDLLPYLAEFTDQIALGGGEPLLFPSFLIPFGKACKENGLILNMTSNGKEILNMYDDIIKEIFKNITMVSISFDRWKWGKEPEQYRSVIERLKKFTGIFTGANFLIDDIVLKKPLLFMDIITWLFTIVSVDRVFALYPKNIPVSQDIRKVAPLYKYMAKKFPGFYIDDLTKEILNYGYSKWPVPCHYGKDIISIDEKGYVKGCSFDKEPLFKLEKPEDILFLRDYKFAERKTCPYLCYRGERDEKFYIKP